MERCSLLSGASTGAGVPCGPPMILFDFDGTLVNSMRLCVTELQEACREMGLPIPPASELQKCNGPSHLEAARMLRVPQPMQEEFCRIRVKWQGRLMGSCQEIYPGVKEMLQALSSCAKLFIASNANQSYIDTSLANWEIGGYFAKAMGCDGSRPKTQLVREMLLEACPCRAMMVGDRLSDIQAGKENGLYTVAARYGFGSAEEWEGADTSAGSVEEVANICMAFCRS